jgi:hypothetical protein
MFLLFPLLNNAQQTNAVKGSLYKINISPGFTYEKGLTNTTTLCLEGNLSVGFAVNNNKTLFLATPFVKSQYRYYYNLDKRVSKGKDISRNSGGFIAITSSFYLKPIGNDVYVSNYDGFTAGGIWGFQKTYKSGINLTANAGLGYNFSDNLTHKVVPLLNFTIGWVIGK